MKAININAQVKFRLSNYGKTKLLSKCTMAYYDLITSKIGEDGYCEMPLWEVMYYFGDDLWMGNNNQPIISNSIYIEESDIKEIEE